MAEITKTDREITSSKVGTTLMMYRYTLIIGVAVLLFLAVAQFFILKSIFNAHRIFDLTSTVNCIEARITGHLELVRQLPHAPPHTRSLTWILDELQGYPFLKGALIAERGKTLINTLPAISSENAREVLSHCKIGYTYEDAYFFCTEFYPLPNQRLFLLVALDRSLEVQTMWRSIRLTGVSLIAGLVIFGFSWYLITRLVRRQQELEHRLAASERLAIIGKLAAMIAHEIRNPLNTVSMGLQYMKELGELNPDMVETLLQEVSHLSELSSDLLSLDRGLDINPASTSLHDILTQIEHRFIPKADQNGISFKVIYPDDDLMITADRKWLLRALENILRNAFEATLLGGSVTLVVNSTKSANVNFTVEDTGLGISQDIRTRIFEPFITTKKDGFGLGLYLVKRVAEAHGGSVTVDEGTHGGTRFTLTIPKGKNT